MTVVLAFDGDAAGDEASTNAVLNVLGVEDDERDYLRAYAMEGKPFRDSIKLLSNENLSHEYRWWSQASTHNWPDWLGDLFKQHAEECMSLINYRSSQINNRGSSDAFKQFNAEHTITDVLNSFGYHAVQGRSVKCPAHDDSSPSLSISKDNGRAYCHNQSCALWHDGYGVDAYELNKILGA